jgi:hypothetical protein
MGALTYNEAVPEDVDALLDNMRTSDADEIEAGTGRPAREVIEESISGSHHSGALRMNGQLLAIVGIGDGAGISGVELRAGVPWLLGTNEIDKYPVAFMRWSHERVRIFMDDYDLLCNWVHEENTRSIDWLRALGFEIWEADEYGPNGERFYPFVMSKETN